MRRGDWIQTYSGIQFWPLDPNPEEVLIEDISWSLSHQCRFTGHSNRFYSVAEHSLLVSYYSQNQLEGLLHDAAEAYLADVSAPIKPFLKEFKEIEENLLKVIFEKFELKYPISEDTKKIDSRILYDEKKALMPYSLCFWSQLINVEPLGIVFKKYFSCEQVNVDFLKRFKRLMDEK